jgi:hypothetical protein
MATLRGYFDTDFKHDLSANHSQVVRSVDGTLELEIIARLHYDFDSNAKYVSYYVPSTDRLSEVCCHLLSNLDTALSIADRVRVASGKIGEEMAKHSDLQFTGRVFLYHDGVLSAEQCSALHSLATDRGISLRLRGPQYAAELSAIERPLAFISHDSRDKDQVARPLAIQLSKLMCPVWFDEFSLTVGDSLRESIESGLKECKKCIIVLSPSFFANEGWTKVEFNSIFTREIIEQNRFILPVWHNVEKRQVFDYCPSLADKFAVPWQLGVEEVARRLYKAIQ